MQDNVLHCRETYLIGVGDDQRPLCEAVVVVQDVEDLHRCRTTFFCHETYLIGVGDDQRPLRGAVVVQDV